MRFATFRHASILGCYSISHGDWPACKEACCVQLALEEAIQSYLRKQEQGEDIDLTTVADSVLKLSASLAEERDHRVQEGASLGFSQQ